MKAKYLLIIPAVAALIGTQSCSVSTHTKEIKTMDIEFDQLSRTDIIVVGNLKAEATISGKGSNARFTALEKTYAQNLKVGKVNDLVTQFYEEVKPTGFDVFLAIIGSFVGVQSNVGPQYKLVTDYSMEFALLALMEKYPDIDYFTNIKTERISVKTGANLTETVKIMADGIELKTDK